MTLFSFIRRSAAHFWTGHLGLLLGAFLAAAILSGSLLVGDSVRASLRRVAELRLGNVRSGIVGGDRWFTEALARRANAAPCIMAMGSVSAANGQTRVNGAQILGVDDAFWKLGPSGKIIALSKGDIAINEALARKLGAKPGDSLLLRLERPSAISRDAPLSGSTNEDVSLRRKIGTVVSADDFGTFQLAASQIPPDAVFVSLVDLQVQIQMEGRVNGLLSQSADMAGLRRTIEDGKSIADFALKLKRVEGRRREWEISTDRIFLDRSLDTKLRESLSGSYGVLTYLVNGIKSAKGATPYSMITAVEATTPNLQPGGVITLEPEGSAISAFPPMTITEWLAVDQNLAAGDKVEISYFVVGMGRELKQVTTTFAVSGIIPMKDPAVTKAWTPEFPGVSDVDNCRDWEPGIPMDMKAIRDKDEKYWDDYKGTPKGFISLAEGQKLWSNRFGQSTALRFADTGQNEATLPREIAQRLVLGDVGLVVRDFAGEARAASRGSVDFGGLFVGLSLFLIAAALVFAALLFLFTVERRASQIGLLLAVGWTPRQVRCSLLGEAGLIAIIGCVLGVFGGELYTRLALRGLSGAWSGASQGLPLQYAGSAGTLIGSGAGAVVVVLLTLWWASRKQFKAPARELLGGGVAYVPAHTGHSQGRRRVGGILRRLALPVCVAGAVGLLIAGKFAKAPEAVAGMFFGSGTLLLVAGLLIAGRWMRRDVGRVATTLLQMGLRNVSRRPSRSLAVIGMMAGGIFLVTAVNAFRMGSGDVTQPRSGTGGFELIAESSLPVYEDLNSKAGMDAFGLDEKLMAEVKVVPFRVRDGDDASCLNLNRAQRPVLVGVDPAKLAGTFGWAGGQDWQALTHPESTPPAIADQATAMWGLGKGVGDAIAYEGASGKPFGVQLAGLLAASVLQGKMIISEAAFLARYPDAAGYRFFLIDAPPEKAAEVSAHLTRQLEQRGFAVEPAVQRLEAFLSVQNTYIGIFTILGGLGVLLGTAGLGVLVARHVLERRGELGLMQAVGFLPAALRRLVLGEHVALLIGGLILGVVAACIAVWPGLRQGGGDLPVGFLAALLGAVLAFGIAICTMAVSLAVRGRLIDAIRRE